MWTLKLAFINIGRCMCALGWDRKGRMQYSNLGNWTMSVYTGIITYMTDVQNGTASAGWANGSLFLGYFKETLGAPLAGRLASSPWHASSEGYFVLIIYQTFFSLQLLPLYCMFLFLRGDASVIAETKAREVPLQKNKKQIVGVQGC